MPPFHGGDDKTIMARVRKGSFNFDHKVWDDVSDSAKDFISKLLTYDVKDRPSAEKALQHPWLAERTRVKVDADKAVGALKNLASFRAEQVLKQATFAFIASQMLSKQEKESMAKVFKAFDKNGDGKLSMEEVKEGYLNHYGKMISDEEVEAMFKQVDTDNSGYIDYSEFLVAAINEEQIMSNEKLKAAFNMFDKDGSGYITHDEIREVLSFGGVNKMNKDAIDTIVKQVDENNDGAISFDEFAAMMRNLISS